MKGGAGPRPRSTFSLRFLTVSAVPFHQSCTFLLRLSFPRFHLKAHQRYRTSLMSRRNVHDSAVIGTRQNVTTMTRRTTPATRGTLRAAPTSCGICSKRTSFPTPLSPSFHLPHRFSICSSPARYPSSPSFRFRPYIRPPSLLPSTSSSLMSFAARDPSLSPFLSLISVLSSYS